MSILKSILEGKAEFINEKLDEIRDLILEDIKNVLEDEVITESRFKITNRVRNGKVQRRKKISNQPGYRFQDGKLVRMTSREKLNRKRAQRKGALKRKSKTAQMLRKRKISIKKRGAL